jgi:outer membrane protein OmpA-like peptidoglycan-associated protein
VLKKLFLLSFIAIFNCMLIYAGSELVGTTSSNYLKIPPFARAVGMGEAFTAVSDGTSGIYYNPAGMTSTLGYEIQATHISWFQQINYEFLTLVVPSPIMDLGKVGVALSWFQVDKMLSSDALPSYDQAYLNSGVDFSQKQHDAFYPHDYSIFLGYALDIKDDLSAGINLKFTSENISSFNGYNFTGDLGLIYKVYFMDSYLRLGGVVSNLGNDLKMQNLGFAPPTVFKFGMSDQFTVFENRALVSAQAIVQLDYESLYSIGAEYLIHNTLALRAGYEMGAFEHPTFGAGIRVNSVELDYAYENYEELGVTHRISLTYDWGTPPCKLEVYPRVFSPNNDKFLDFAYFRPGIKAPEKVESMKIDIFDPSGKNILTSIDVKHGETKIPWDGRANGIILRDGVYSARLTAKYADGESVSNPVPVEIDNTPPEMRIDADPKLLRPGQQDALVIPSTFTFFAQDRNKVASWQLVIWDKDKAIFFNIGGKGEPPLSYIWDGRGKNGQYVNTGDIYYYSLITTDSLGNKGSTPLQSQVVLLKEVKLTFGSDALFALGEANVKITAYSVLKQMKTVLDKFPESEISVAGYTDNLQPKGVKYRDNKELSKARADAVKFFMVNLLDMDEKLIKTEGYGELMPIATNDTLEGRLKNRRVEITIHSTIYK